MAEQLRRRRALQREKEYIEEQRLDGRAAARVQVTTSNIVSSPLRLLSNHPLYPSILCYIQQLIITIVLMFPLFIPAFCLFLIVIIICLCVISQRRLVRIAGYEAAERNLMHYEGSSHKWIA